MVHQVAACVNGHDFTIIQSNANLDQICIADCIPLHLGKIDYAYAVIERDLRS